MWRQSEGGDAHSLEVLRRLDAARARHGSLQEKFEAEIQRLDRIGRALSAARLVTMVTAVSLMLDGCSRESRSGLAFGGLVLVGFVGLVIAHAVLAARRDEASTRKTIHTRHLQRLSGGWTSFPLSHSCTVPENHEYAQDIDLVGQASLLQRIDTTHTLHGERTLLAWLSAPSSVATILRRQAAVQELSDATELRQELEASVRHEPGTPKVSAGRFTDFTSREDLIGPPLLLAARLLPFLTAAGIIWQLSGRAVWLTGFAPLAIQLALALRWWAPIGRKFQLLDARRRDVEGLEKLLLVIEGAAFESPLLIELRRALDTAGLPPSRQLRRLRFWIGLADLRMQPMVHPFVNAFLLWDIHVAAGIERWNRQSGRYVGRWCEVAGQIEALASLATLHATDPATTFPELTDDGDVTARALAHPLLGAERRQPNDLTVPGPDGVVIVTGSNMAGKSTLLRAVGLNLVLAFCGGPVCAASLRTPVLRLRASTRARDSLETGASYFRAELTKLTTVIARLDDSPPVFFLLDELLRGTNARARAIGARAVVTHLAGQQARGLVATHDYTLCDLEDERGVRAVNVHFTDVMVSGEMTFDYKLRPGRATTSNALRLLEMAGIPVPREDFGHELAS